MRPLLPVTLLVVLTSACTSTEPLDLPDDVSERGVPVGVRTVSAQGQTIEVWYPAADSTDASGASDDVVALEDQVTDAFKDALAGTIDFPSYTQAAVRDAAIRSLDGPLPVIVFSHGFGGFRTQSTGLTTHLASRGYVVVAADHPGRMLADVAPCLLNPPPGPCSVGFIPGGDDPAVADVADVLTWLEGSPEELEGLLDLEHLGIFGHSAGGNTTTTVANQDTRFQAALPMAGGNDFSRELPSAILAGTCDGIVQSPALVDAGPTTRDGTWLLAGAGHMAFSDLCSLDLGVLADAIGERDDANGLVLTGLRRLATDGCPGATPAVEGCTSFLDLPTGDRILRAATTAFFDATLKAQGGGLTDVGAAELTPAVP